MSVGGRTTETGPVGARPASKLRFSQSILAGFQLFNFNLRNHAILLIILNLVVFEYIHVDVTTRRDNLRATLDNPRHCLPQS